MANKKKQIEKFKEAAKEVNTHTDETDFDNALKKIAKTDIPREGQQKSDGGKPKK